MHIRTPKQNFMAAASQVIPVVSKFGEEIIARLVRGQVVSDEEDFLEISDVYRWDTLTGFQVKMCNSRHAQRPTARQIEKMFFETRRKDKPFVAEIRRGIYALVFYDGIHNKNNPKRGKSKLLSRRINTEEKFEIIANEIQYIYLIEIDLLHHFSHSDLFTDVHRYGSCKVHNQRKICCYRDRLILYLTRTFLSGFMGEIPKRLGDALNRSFGKGRWCVEEKLVEFEFNNSISFKRKIPVKFIGRKKTHLIIDIQPKIVFDLNTLT